MEGRLKIVSAFPCILIPAGAKKRPRPFAKGDADTPRYHLASRPVSRRDALPGAVTPARCHGRARPGLTLPCSAGRLRGHVHRAAPRPLSPLPDSLSRAENGYSSHHCLSPMHDCLFIVSPRRGFVNKSFCFLRCFRAARRAQKSVHSPAAAALRGMYSAKWRRCERLLYPNWCGPTTPCSSG